MLHVRSRVLQVLRLFTPSKSLWTVEEVALAIGVSASSAYRYVQELSASGFLDKVRGGYALGPALVELDYLIRAHDPLIHSSVPLLRELLDQTSQMAVAILCRRYRDHVLCVHQELGTAARQHGGLERGFTLPPFQGATARVILANQTDRVQRRVYAQEPAAVNTSNDVQSWREFAAEAARIRRDGYVESRGGILPGLREVAAPIFFEGRLLAAVSLVIESGLDVPEMASAAVVSTARAITNAIASEEVLVAR